MAIFQTLNPAEDPARQARIGRAVGALGAAAGALSLILLMNPFARAELLTAGLAGLLALALSVWVIGGLAGRAIGRRAFPACLWVGPLSAIACMALSFGAIFLAGTLSSGAAGAFWRNLEELMGFLVFGALPAAALGLPCGITIWWLIKAPEEETEPSGPAAFER